MQSHFDSLAQTLTEESIEFWFARDLQEPLGYAKWENFLTTIMRAIESCKTTGCDPDDHFRGIRKMITYLCPTKAIFTQGRFFSKKSGIAALPIFLKSALWRRFKRIKTQLTYSRH